MVALQISSKIESLYGLGRQAKKLEGFVWNFATFVRLPFEQFSAENSQTWLGSFSFSNISVEMSRFSISCFCNWLWHIKLIWSCHGYFGSTASCQNKIYGLT